ncbi:30S ribosomal protein S12 methylthiotransferase RimO [Prevotella sp. E15-22]|jgi:ribosomal protein S12 methylthiotransferase|uniref:30S ribosomal protein S12 methylthiotransferase RimO n=1 Tax=Prevotella sp. E15-22 TaxID=2937774 RepID=UPI0020508343|nr:30S ribosomal protein S12 methylthiotransferase RimO [Prevotella sp. E15-22]UPS45724.1 30S ribosomal protein S12 methylthiotransferase RimO [Prevotella sp. E15-22]
MMKTIDFISLGCSKNLVDSENLMGMFEAKNFHVTHDSDNPKGEVVVVNTCGFIADAKEESINTILEQVARKNEGKVQKIFVMGCLSERYLADLEAEIPEVDGWYGKFNYRQLLEDLLKSEDCPADDSEMGKCNVIHRKLTTPSHYAYIKISEGCDRHCAYCAIPLITGRHQSRPMEDILDEVRWLVSQGTKEFQVIAQELTYYGVDIYGEQRIAELIERMADIDGVEWIRLHYAYPNHFPWGLLRVMREKKNVCRYMDIALQHISDHMLTRMRRNTSKKETMELIERMRREVPGIHLRTTLMVGFPGETDEDFQELVDFVKWARFERMGAFSYSEEDGTYSAEHYEDDVPEEVKEQRLSRLMRVQQNISAEIEAEKVGQTLPVIIDRIEGDYYIGRTEFCSPEVDPEVLISIHDETLEIGKFYQVRIIDSEEFDLYGIVEK